MNLGNRRILICSFLLISLLLGLNGDDNEKSKVGKGKHEVSKILTKLALLDEFHSSEPFPNSNTNEHSSLTIHLLEKAFNAETTLSSFKQLCTGYKDLAANNARIYLRNAALVDAFLDSVFETEVIRTAVGYLTSRGHLSASGARSIVKRMWFGDFSSDSSAFRQRFCMLPTAKPEQTISKNWGGNWLGFYLQNNQIPFNEKKTSQDMQVKIFILQIPYTNTTDLKYICYYLFPVPFECGQNIK
ncbi:endoribonuclease xendoU domain-containing protein [Ditylenchus destructor]|uniref:Endoribonuclease xendoU domain-containing protein n=1 Tax=Ditylenchus destructor TaxID=166010 RepID=A0AAD4N9B2_9BILA|nr:endoribonuclease xendoU domain-containing protein [Ditylenchus destructor]